jgi:ribonuclease HI
LNGSSNSINLAKGHGHLGTNASVFQAETYAIKAALEQLQSLPNVANTPITLHNDSQATLKSLAIQPTTSKTTLARQNKLIEVCSERIVTLR